MENLSSEYIFQIPLDATNKINFILKIENKTLQCNLTVMIYIYTYVWGARGIAEMNL